MRPSIAKLVDELEESSSEPLNIQSARALGVSTSAVEQVWDANGVSVLLPTYRPVDNLHQNGKLDRRQIAHPMSDNLLILLQRP